MTEVAISDGETFRKKFSVSRETIERLVIYHNLLKKWQKVQNLVSPSTLDRIWHRHFADSAQLVPLIGDSKIVVDLGSGGGFPGMVLAILLQERPDFTLQLVEANGRKCAFLKDVARATSTHVEIHNCRIEVFAIESTIPKVDVITARALKPLKDLLQFGLFGFEKGAKGVFLKGQTFQTEIDEALELFDFEVVCHQSQTDEMGRIVEIFNVKPRV